MNTLSIYTATFAFFALSIWFFFRKKFKRVLLPTIRIIPDPKKNLPRIKFAKPPLLAFLTMLISLAAIIFLTTFPSVFRSDPKNKNKPKIHLFLDLSPSVFSQVSSEQYEKIVQSTVQSLLPSSRLYLSLSDSPHVYEINSLDELKTISSKIVPHRFGTRIGASLKATLNNNVDFSGLIIFSDADSFSWQDLNWKSSPYAIDRIDLVNKKIISNIYIQEVKTVGSNKQNIQRFDVAIGRSGPQQTTLKPISGTLNAWLSNKLLSQTPWEFSKNERLINTLVPLNLIEKLNLHSFIRWELVTNLPVESDAISQDNEFRTGLGAQLLHANIIADQTQEFDTFDSQRFLVSTLKALGATVKRTEKVDLTTAFQDFGFIVFQISNLEAAEQCRYLQTIKVPVWLMPKVGGSVQDLCTCLDVIFKGAKSTCQSEQDVTKYINSGARIIENNTKEGFIQFIPSNKNVTLTLFFDPLVPTSTGTSGHSDFIKSIRRHYQTTLTELRLKGLSLNSWPRFETFSDEESQDIKGEYESNIRLSNVPLKESLLNTLQPSEMPPVFNEKKFLLNLDAQGFERTRDSLPVIRWIAFLCLSMILVEAFFSLLLLFRSRKNSTFAALCVMIACSLESRNVAMAGVQITLVTEQKNDVYFEQLSRDVAQRTSIEINPKPILQNQFRLDSIAEPFVMLTNPNLIFTGSKISPDFIGWLKRGGFFVAFFNSDKVETALKLAGFKAGIFAQDHELMRSFYLLNRLPQCGQLGWRAIEIDQRLVGIEAPPAFFDSLNDKSQKQKECPSKTSKEEFTRIFINMIMVVLATDYKKDQIHLPEILKRLK